MMRWRPIRLILFLAAVLEAMSVPGMGQTTSPQLNGTQSVVPLSQQATTQTDAANAAAPAAGVTSSPVAPGVGTAISSSVGKSFGTAGQGLPGLPGGPPLNGIPGGQDPSGQYMRPPSIPPLLCDPAVDIPCM
ncbi:MAG: hypothetical protein GDA67_06595 [Nitrospira sp. CR1.3]|nr:hypothetical protein [Nitrospira sp. CR1.3]